MVISRRMLGKHVALLAALPVASTTAPFGTAPLNSQSMQRGQLYIRRYAPSLTTDGERALISGGAPIGAGNTENHTHSAVMALVEAIDPVSLEQKFIANALFPRANHASIWLNGQLWLMGGRTQVGDERRLAAEVERVDLESEAIWRGPDLPLVLIDLSAVVHGHSIFVFGGIYRDGSASASKPSNRVFECAPPYDSWVERERMPVAIGSMATVVANNKIYLVGGFDRQQAHAITQVFDPVSNSWSFGPPPPRPLSAHAGAGSDNRLFLFGDYQKQNSVLGFNIASGEWRDLSIPFTPRRHVRAVRVRERVIVAGGNQSSLAPATDVLEVFDLEFLNNAFDAA